jgi:hypothetical protein
MIVSSEVSKPTEALLYYFSIYYHNIHTHNSTKSSSTNDAPSASGFNSALAGMAFLISSPFMLENSKLVISSGKLTLALGY